MLEGCAAEVSGTVVPVICLITVDSTDTTVVEVTTTVEDAISVLVTTAFEQFSVESSPFETVAVAVTVSVTVEVIDAVKVPPLWVT